jgi:hypothetical protein
MKKAGLLIIVLLSSILSTTILVQSLNENSIPQVQGITQASDKVIGVATNAASAENLAKAWQDKFLSNPMIKNLDRMLKKLNFLSVILLGTDYSFSLTFLITVILWILVLVLIGDWARSALGLTEGVTYLFGGLAAVALSQGKIIPRIASFSVRLIFSQESGLSRTFISILVFAIIFVLFFIKSGISKVLDERRKKRNEEKAEEAQDEIITFNQEMIEAANG